MTTADRNFLATWDVAVLAWRVFNAALAAPVLDLATFNAASNASANACGALVYAARLADTPIPEIPAFTARGL